MLNDLHVTVEQNYAKILIRSSHQLFSTQPCIILLPISGELIMISACKPAVEYGQKKSIAHPQSALIRFSSSTEYSLKTALDSQSTVGRKAPYSLFIIVIDREIDLNSFAQH